VRNDCREEEKNQLKFRQQALAARFPHGLRTRTSPYLLLRHEYIQFILLRATHRERSLQACVPERYRTP